MPAANPADHLTADLGCGEVYRVHRVTQRGYPRYQVTAPCGTVLPAKATLTACALLIERWEGEPAVGVLCLLDPTLSRETARQMIDAL